MTKRPFDENGLQSLLSELYALADEQLYEEAIALKNHPKLWINGHFELDQKQLDFLDGMPLSNANFLGDQGSFVILNRLPVTLEKKQVDKKDGDDDDQDKFFKVTSHLISSTDNLGNAEASGSLALTVTYLASAEVS